MDPANNPIQDMYSPPPPPDSGDGGPLAKINAAIAQLTGILDNHPWERWVSVANDFIGKWLPLVVAIAGVLAFLIGFITAIRAEFPFGAVMGNFGFLAVALASLHLTPKALALPRTFLEKREPDPMRPELLYILKTTTVFATLISATILILRFDGAAFATALVILAAGALLTVVFGNPSLIGVKAAYPQNAIEETLCILLLPLKFVLSLSTLLVGIGTVAVFVYGIVQLFDRYVGEFMAIQSFNVSILAPVAIPLVVYLAYLVVTFTLDFYRAIVAVPRKLDELRKALEDKN